MAHYIEHILKPILELRPESIQRRLIIHADNARSQKTKKSQELSDQNYLKIPPIRPTLRI
jgi:hypothetical protein